MTYHIGNSDPGHMHLKQQLEKNMKITFTSPSKNSAEKEEKKKRKTTAKLLGLHAKNANCKAFCVT